MSFAMLVIALSPLHSTVSNSKLIFFPAKGVIFPFRPFLFSGLSELKHIYNTIVQFSFKENPYLFLQSLKIAWIVNTDKQLWVGAGDGAMFSKASSPFPPRAQTRLENGSRNRNTGNNQL